MSVMPNPSALWEPAPGVRVRGTLAVIGGRDEAARVYERFGRRIATDGYVVGVFETAEQQDAREWLWAQDVAPRVLVGSDAGAAAVLTALAERDQVDGAIVAGTPVGSDDTAAPDAAARSACPVHLGVLGDASSHAVHDAAQASLPDAGFLEGVTVPVLAVHGGADTIAPFDAATGYLATLPALEVVETVDGLHDALNDHSHRSVAAHVVLWLERLRAGDVSTPIVRAVARVDA
jgi:pimeloyl-ACP methyl ester carboxylesterase